MAIYAVDSGSVAGDVREWAIENGENPLLRIVLAGYDAEHVMPPNWRKRQYSVKGGYGNQGKRNVNRHRECLWFSPHCETGSGLFDEACMK